MENMVANFQNEAVVAGLEKVSFGAVLKLIGGQLAFVEKKTSAGSDKDPVWIVKGIEDKRLRIGLNESDILPKLTGEYLI